MKLHPKTFTYYAVCFKNPQACRAAFTPTSDLMVFCIATWVYFSFPKTHQNLHRLPVKGTFQLDGGLLQLTMFLSQTSHQLR